MNRAYMVGAALALGVVAACDAVGDSMSGHREIVAHAAGHRLTTERAADMLAVAAPNVAPADPEIAQRFATIWAEYTLLAVEIASPDSLDDLSLDALLDRQTNQELVWQLREVEILPRAKEVGEEELRAAYDTAQPGVSFRASHILLHLPDDPAGREGVRRLADSLRARAAAGADFGTLARRHSVDPGSARQGGDLGWFGRGRMVPEFEEAVRVLEPGQVSPVVESRFGLHIIKLLERRQPSLEQVADQVRGQLERDRIQALEDAYIDSLVARAEVKIRPGAAETARELALAGPYAPVSAARRKEKLATYRGGALTVDEYLRFLSLVPAQTVQFFARGNDQQVQFGLERIVRDELLIRAAHDRGVTVDPAVRDSMEDFARRQLAVTARAAGFTHGALAAGDTAIDRHVERLLEAALQGRRPVGPLGAIAVALREKHTARVYPERFADVAVRLQTIRAARDSAARSTHPEPPADTARTIR